MNFAHREKRSHHKLTQEPVAMTMLTAVKVMAMQCGTPPSTEGMDTSRKTGPGYLKWPAEARGCQGALTGGQSLAKVASVCWGRTEWSDGVTQSVVISGKRPAVW